MVSLAMVQIIFNLTNFYNLASNKIPLHFQRIIDLKEIQYLWDGNNYTITFLLVFWHFLSVLCYSSQSVCGDFQDSMKTSSDVSNEESYW